MATVYKTLGQAAPGATTNTDIYTVPASTQTVCSTLAVCNRGASTTFRVAIRVGGAAIEAKQYIVYDRPLNQYDSLHMTLGLSLAATDIITVYAGSANLSFNLFGAEVSS